MTLSNIFFGKKVVQQAYLNNALIYQSKGWETLPSTCMEVWRKNYSKFGRYISHLVKDSQDSIIFLQDSNIVKIDTDGTLLYSASLPKASRSDYSIDYYLVTDLENNIWVAANYYYYNSDFDYYTQVKIYKYSYDLKLQSTFDYYTSFNKADHDEDNEVFYPKIKLFLCRNNLLYVFSDNPDINVNGSYYYDVFIHIFNLDFKLVNSVNYAHLPFGGTDSIYIADVDYQGNIYFAWQSSMLRFSSSTIGKNNEAAFVLNNIPSDGTTVSSSSYIKAIYIDKQRNIYYIKDNCLIKMDYNYKKLWSTYIPGYNNLNLYYTNNIVCDKQDNIYFYGYGTDTNGSYKNRVLYKFSSDGTFIWSNEDTNCNNESFATDRFNNIYTTVDLIDGMDICKITNIEKKGN